MKTYKGFLIDLDGTMYRGAEKIAEAVQFVQKLHERKLPYLFVTNNSTKTADQVATLLQSMDVPATAADVLTTSAATASYIVSKRKNARVYAIGETGLKEALLAHELVLDERDPEFVVIGLDRSLTYEKMATAALFIQKGATFIATNGDVALPFEHGFLPGNGSIVAAISLATKVEPIFIGKPEPIIIEEALQRLGTKRKETLMVGDNYDTDISAGIRAQIDTLLVYTGVATKEQIAHVSQKPTYTVDSLAEWSV